MSERPPGRATPVRLHGFHTIDRAGVGLVLGLVGHTDRGQAH